MPNDPQKKRLRPLNTRRLEKLVTAAMRPQFGMGASVYTVELLIPVMESTKRGVRPVATSQTLVAIRQLLCRAFGGATRANKKRGWWQGTGKSASTSVENTHAAFEITAAPIEQSLTFLRALKRELERALGEQIVFLRIAMVTLL